MKNIIDSPIIKEFCSITDNMYRLGWDEKNGGNISYLLEEEDLIPYLNVENVIRRIPFTFDAKPLAGRYFLVTGTGEYFRNVSRTVDKSLGIFRISKQGDAAELLWGYSENGKFTSELPSHLITHMTRLKVDPTHRVVMHCHPTNIVAMTQVYPLDSKVFTKALWRTMTECMVVFPDGIAVLPWMLSGTNTIALETAKKMEEYRLVIWSLHGIYGVGKSLDDAFGLIETVEKSAELFMKVSHLKQINTITDEQLIEIANGYNVSYKKEFFE